MTHLHHWPPTTTTPPSSMDIDPLLVDLDVYLADPTSPAALEEASKAAQSLILTGALTVRDSRASKSANDRFLDLFEDYFAQDDDALRADERPEFGYQVVRATDCNS